MGSPKSNKLSDPISFHFKPYGHENSTFKDIEFTKHLQWSFFAEKIYFIYSLTVLSKSLLHRCFTDFHYSLFYHTILYENLCRMTLSCQVLHLFMLHYVYNLITNLIFSISYISWIFSFALMVFIITVTIFSVFGNVTKLMNIMEFLNL